MLQKLKIIIQHSMFYRWAVFNTAKNISRSVRPAFAAVGVKSALSSSTPAIRVETYSVRDCIYAICTQKVHVKLTLAPILFKFLMIIQ